MFGVYIHVPFCSSRCGYCDFNTYVPGPADLPDASATFLSALERELELGAAQRPGPADTVFVGGGTPSLLGADGLARILDAVRSTFGLAPGAEVTTEANPESTGPEFFEGLLDAGYTRVSLGMQSASPHVLGVLERRHTPGRAFEAAREARAVGFEHVNLDMIYGTPTETDEDVARTLDLALSTGVDHISAYSLIVEDGTAMARQVRSGALPAPSEDVYADRYEMIDHALRVAGFDWYEVSNWAQPGGQCEHNLIYWRGGEWWGAGPGAHSFVGGRRFFNVKLPAHYARVLAGEQEPDVILGGGGSDTGRSGAGGLDTRRSDVGTPTRRGGALPIAGAEELTEADLHTEAIMLGLRLAEGVPLAWLGEGARGVLERDERAGLLRRFHGNAGEERIAVTGRGRLLADGIIADLLVAEE